MALRFECLTAPEKKTFSRDGQTQEYFRQQLAMFHDGDKYPDKFYVSFYDGEPPFPLGALDVDIEASLDVSRDKITFKPVLATDKKLKAVNS